MPSWGTIAWKDLRLLLRDRVALFWVVGFPLVFALFFGSVMKAGVDSETIPMSVVLVDESTSAMIDPLAASLEHAGLRVSRRSLEQAESAVRRGEAAAFVRIPADGAIQLGIDPSRHTEAAMLQSLLLPPPPCRAPPPTARRYGRSASPAHTAVRVAASRSCSPQ